MSIMISSHNLREMKELIFELKKHYYSLCLLTNQDDSEWPDARIELLWERVSVMSDTIHSFEILENCIHAGRLFNAPEPDFYDGSSDGAEPGHPEQ